MTPQQQWHPKNRFPNRQLFRQRRQGLSSFVPWSSCFFFLLLLLLLLLLLRPIHANLFTRVATHLATARRHRSSVQASLSSLPLLWQKEDTAVWETTSSSSSSSSSSLLPDLFATSTTSTTTTRIRHEHNGDTVTAARTLVDETAQRRRRRRRRHNALFQQQQQQQQQYSDTEASLLDPHGKKNRHRDDENDDFHQTLEVVSLQTKKVRQEIAKQVPTTGFFYGLSPQLVARHTTHAASTTKTTTTTHNNKPLAMRQAVSLTLEELRFMRTEMEALRQEIRALKTEMLGGDETAVGKGLALDDAETLLAQKRKRQREFDRIGREVERWAQHLLFEQDAEEKGEAHGWKQVTCNKVLQSTINPDGRTVAYLKWMKDSRGRHANPDDDREYPCLKVFSTIDAPLEVVCQYLSDERKMGEYNDLIVQHKQVEEVSPHGKICWGQTPQILFIQPRDFLTYCHHRWLRDGTQVLVNQACDTHETFKVQNPQAFALRGANFISRHPDDPSNKTRIALLAHASPGPDIPHWASKTAVKAMVPIEPFKLFSKINQGVEKHRQELEQALPPAEMVSSQSSSGAGGPSVRPAGMAQLGYAAFWPQGGGLQEDGGVGLSDAAGPLDQKDSLHSLGNDNEEGNDGGSLSSL